MIRIFVQRSKHQLRVLFRVSIREELREYFLELFEAYDAVGTTLLKRPIENLNLAFGVFCKGAHVLETLRTIGRALRFGF